MMVGNLLALAQKNIKRLLAYSSIAQAGYMLVGVAAGNESGCDAVVYYLMAYLVTNLAAFGIVTLVGKTTGSDEISSFAGFSRRSPGLGLALLAALLSLGGVPPFAGFFGKFLVFGSAIESRDDLAGHPGCAEFSAGTLLLLDGVENRVSGPIRGRQQAIEGFPGLDTALVIAVVGVIVLGFVFSPWYGLRRKCSPNILDLLTLIFVHDIIYPQ